MINNTIIAVGGYLSFLVFLPSITVIPSTVTNVYNPLATPFILENNGNFSIYKISIETSDLKMTDINNNSVNIGIAKYTNDNNLLTLSKNRQTTIAFLTDKSFQLQSVNSAEFTVKIKYKPFLLYWWHEELFKFILKKGANGQLTWFPINSN